MASAFYTGQPTEVFAPPLANQKLNLVSSTQARDRFLRRAKPIREPLAANQRRKAELREVAMRELKVSKNSFDFAWIDVIVERRLIFARRARGCSPKCTVSRKAIYIALGVLPDGTKEILGIWIEQTEGAKFWLRVVNELKTRGAQDILIAVVDGLKGFPEAINAVFPQTVVQTCVVHLIRHSMDFASWKDRKSVAQALRTVYRAAMQPPARPPSTTLRKVRGAQSIRQSRRAGVAIGSS